MCDIKVEETKPGHLDVTCKNTGKPITVSNKYGMFCEDKCDLEEAKQAANTISKMFGLNLDDL